MASAAGGTSHRLNPGPATIRSFESRPVIAGLVLKNWPQKHREHREDNVETQSAQSAQSFGAIRRASRSDAGAGCAFVTLWPSLGSIRWGHVQDGGRC